ncbi:MAG: hypothetical protein J6Y82_03330 [Bacteroidales bacterium]|nr:hypothetical protein [Bacteroidales bacterium]
MKKLYFQLVSLAMLATCCSTAQQTTSYTYPEALEHFFYSTPEDNSTLGNSLFKMNPNALKLSMKVTTENQTVNISPDSMQYYLENVYEKDLMQTIQPYFEKHVTAEELMEVAEMRTDKRIKTATQHIEEALADTTCLSRIFGSLMSSFFSSIFNPDAQMISIPSECPRKYYDSVAEMCNTAGVGDKIANILGPLGDSQSMGDAIKMKIASTVLGNQLPSLLTNIYWGHVSQDDLDAMNEMFKRPSFAHINEATSEVLTDWPNVSAQIMKRMSEWAVQTTPKK